MVYIYHTQEDKNEFSDRLVRLMKNNKETQASLSRKIGVSDTTLFRYTHGVAYPRPYYIERLCDILKCSYHTLTGKIK